MGLARPGCDRQGLGAEPSVPGGAGLQRELRGPCPRGPEGAARGDGACPERVRTRGVSLRFERAPGARVLLRGVQRWRWPRPCLREGAAFRSAARSARLRSERFGSKTNGRCHCHLGRGLRPGGPRLPGGHGGHGRWASPVPSGGIGGHPRPEEPRRLPGRLRRGLALPLPPRRGGPADPGRGVRRLARVAGGVQRPVWWSCLRAAGPGVAAPGSCLRAPGAGGVWCCVRTPGRRPPPLRHARGRSDGLPGAPGPGRAPVLRPGPRAGYLGRHRLPLVLPGVLGPLRSAHHKQAHRRRVLRSQPAPSEGLRRAAGHGQHRPDRQGGTAEPQRGILQKAGHCLARLPGEDPRAVEAGEAKHSPPVSA
mmetsp:Transcript_98072/g.305419  ORF Transcript_98072/g.305419 Transcript_98072/m.305419 type:complete len:366 (+) Transcript_98072:452-1549(+)